MDGGDYRVFTEIRPQRFVEFVPAADRKAAPTPKPDLAGDRV